MAQTRQDSVIALLREQMEQQRQQTEIQMEQQRQQMEQQRQQMEALMSFIADRPKPVATKFDQFDSCTELWTDYLSRFQTFCKANNVPETNTAEIFLTNQSSDIYRLLKNLAGQQTPPKEINDLTMDEITDWMGDHFNPKRFVVRERFRYWSTCERKPGETVQQLAARIRQEAATCDFASIKDPLDEAMRTRFVCSVKNEATIKALFKIKDDDLTFARAIEIAAEIEEASKAAKETSGNADEVFKLAKFKSKTQHQPSTSTHQKQQTSRDNTSRAKGQLCSRCDGKHSASECRFANVICHFCNIKGHIEKACRKKRRQARPVKTFQTVRWNTSEPLVYTCSLDGRAVEFEVDTGSGDNFISYQTWQLLNKPKLSAVRCQYRCASNKTMPVVGVVKLPTSSDISGPRMTEFVVTKFDLNLLGRRTIKRLKNIS